MVCTLLSRRDDASFPTANVASWLQPLRYDSFFVTRDAPSQLNATPVHMAVPAVANCQLLQ